MEATGNLTHDTSTNNPPETLEEKVRRENAAFLKEAQEWIESAGRAPEVTSAEINEKIGKTVQKLTKLQTQAKTIHKAVKQPHLDNCRTVDEIFLTGIVKTIDTAKTKLVDLQRPWLRKVQQEAAAAAEAEAERRRQEEEAARLESEQRLREAEALQNKGEFDAADAALREAAKLEEAAGAANEKAAAAEERAEGPVADLVRQHSTLGVTISGQVEYVTTYVGPRDKVDWQALAPYIAEKELLRAAKAAVKAGRREIAGFTITEDIKPINR